MSDLISRHSAIEAIEQMQMPIMRSEFSEEQFVFTGMSEALRAIKELPSEQPDRELIEQLRWERDTAIQQLKDLGYGLGEKPKTDDTISRQAAIDVLEERLQANGYSNVALVSEFNRSIGYLRRLPSVQPEFIRCRDCKHWDKTWTNNWSPDYHYCPMIDGVRKGDFYCADAERRTE